jgi:DNA mismatch repair protein MutS
MAKTPKLTPMFRQYRSIKQDHPEAILLFRMGDFYEMFYEDAREASRALELTLTARGKGTDHEVPMCGFPHHQLEGYGARLVKAGFRVAVCEQVEDPREAKGLVRREVVRVLTPGTLPDAAGLESGDNCWAAGVAMVNGQVGAAFLDAGTGEFIAWERSERSDPWSALGDRLARFAPREIVYPESLPWTESYCSALASDALLTPLDPYTFSHEAAETLLKRHFGVASLDGFGLGEKPAAVAASGGLLLYLQDTQRSGLEHIDHLAVHEPSRHLLLDPATRRNLEIDRSLRDGSRRNSLFATVDSTTTPAGGRLLRSWLLAPLLDPARITDRLDAVEEWLRRHDLRGAARAGLTGVLDIERLTGRVVAGTAGPRELAALRSSLQRLPGLAEELNELSTALLRETLDDMDPCQDLAELLEQAIVEEPPLSSREGGIIAAGHSAELDELQAISRDGKSFIAALESRERESTGIGSLKVRFNKVFGYFIEVTRSNLERVPEHYHRKQTIANGERFITPELKEYEAKVLNAQERIVSLEHDLFCGLRSRIAAAAPRLKQAARCTAVLDVLAGLAETAAAQGFSKPVIEEGPGLTIRGGRHPVVEQNLVDHRFTPNDTVMEAGGRSIIILTGPNMGGKSTYLRQVALITILAQSGSFVPAEEATVGIVDRVFCRVGASDNLAEGQSTFMVEMTETANILHHATMRSLVLLDEIGRGTSTFDGLSIAWAVVEQLQRMAGGAPRTLFATHYHELTELAVQYREIINSRMAVRDGGDGVVFTHRVEPGASDRSYGIHVARLAGIPRPVIDRAREILGNLEKDAYGRDGLPRLSRSGEGGDRHALSNSQASLFPMMRGEPVPPSREPDDPAVAEVLASLREQSPEEMTPVEALLLLDELCRKLK